MRSLSDIFGQSRAIHTLQSAVQSEKIHHAWIFHGPAGVGKFETARAWAAVLLDPQAGPNLAGEIEADPDGHAVQQIRSGNHADFHVIRKELAAVSRDSRVRANKQISIPKDVILEYLTEPASLSGHADKDHPALASKMFIVDEAELMNRDGQNVLLKTLEEPPPGTVIILVTSSVDRLLPTVRSRCQRIGFGALDDKSMEQWLSRHEKEQDIEVNVEVRDWLLRFAAGSPGLAAIGLENDFFQWYEEIAPHLRTIWQGRYVEGFGKRLSKMIDEFATDWVKGRKNASKGAANQAGARYMFQLIAAEMQAALRTTIERGMSPDRVIHLLELLQEAEQQLHSNIGLEMVFENLIIQWSAGRTDASVWFTTSDI